jgi:hypothetical protein
MSQKGPIQSRLLPTHTERLLRTPPYFREASGYRGSPQDRHERHAAVRLYPVLGQRPEDGAPYP